MSYEIGDKVETLIGGKWLPAVITKAPHKDTGNYGVRVKHGKQTINTVSSLDQLRKATMKEALTFKEFLLTEKTVTIRNSAISKTGAPADKARAFDKVHGGTGKRPNRSVLAKFDKAKHDGSYHAIEFSDEEDFVMVLVMKSDVEGSYHRQNNVDPYKNYYGVNVLFFPNGKIDAETYDPTAKNQWVKDKAKIIKIAKDSLKDKDLPGIYDGLGGVSNKRGTGKLSVDIDEGKARGDYIDVNGRYVPAKEPKMVKTGGVSTEELHFGFESRKNAKKVDAALQKLGWSEGKNNRETPLAQSEYARSSNFGISYFHFGDKASMNKAVNLAKQVIDKSEESEWS